MVQSKAIVHLIVNIGIWASVLTLWHFNVINFLPAINSPHPFIDLTLYYVIINHGSFFILSSHSAAVPSPDA